jgi:hypothetical protein
MPDVPATSVVVADSILSAGTEAEAKAPFAPLFSTATPPPAFAVTVIQMWFSAVVTLEVLSVPSGTV